MKRPVTAVSALVSAAVTLVLGAPVDGHHAAAPFYEQGRTVEIEGVVTRFVFKNPHAFLYIEVTDEKGAKTEWAVELGAPILLTRAGWTPDTIKPGDPIRAKGAPSRAAGTHGIGFGTLTKPDGSTFVDSGR